MRKSKNTPTPTSDYVTAAAEMMADRLDSAIARLTDFNERTHHEDIELRREEMRLRWAELEWRKQQSSDAKKANNA